MTETQDCSEMTPPFAVGDVVRRISWQDQELTAEVVEVVMEVRYHLVCRGSWAPEHAFDVQHVDVPEFVKVQQP